MKATVTLDQLKYNLEIMDLTDIERGTFNHLAIEKGFVEVPCRKEMTITERGNNKSLKISCSESILFMIH